MKWENFENFIFYIGERMYVKAGGGKERTEEKGLRAIVSYYTDVIIELCLELKQMDKYCSRIEEKLDKLRRKNFEYEKQLGIDKICEEE